MRMRMRMRTWMRTDDGAILLFFRLGYGGLVKVLLLPLPPVTGDLSDCSQSLTCATVRHGLDDGSLVGGLGGGDCVPKSSLHQRCLLFFYTLLHLTIVINLYIHFNINAWSLYVGLRKYIFFVVPLTRYTFFLYMYMLRLINITELL